jgi:hypothetical protein
VGVCGLDYFWFRIGNQQRVLMCLHVPQSMHNCLPEQPFNLSRNIQPQGSIYLTAQLVGYCLFVLKVG